MTALARIRTSMLPILASVGVAMSCATMAAAAPAGAPGPSMHGTGSHHTISTRSRETNHGTNPSVVRGPHKDGDGTHVSGPATSPTSTRPDESGSATTGYASTPRDQDLAFNIVTNGDAKALPLVLNMLTTSVPGNVLSVDLRRASGGSWIYNVLVLDKSGSYKDVVVDAKGVKIIEVRTR